MSDPIPSTDSSANSGSDTSTEADRVQADSVSLAQPLSEALSGLHHAGSYARAVGSVADTEARLNATNATLVIAASVAGGVLMVLVWLLILALSGWWLTTFGLSIPIILVLALVVNVVALVVTSRYIGAMLDQFGFPRTLSLLGSTTGD